MRPDVPIPDPDTEPYWEAARQHRLLIRWCRSCQRHSFYPRPFCPHCWSTDVEWVQASGRASLYTYSVVHVNDLPPFNERVPYVAAIVELEEGPRMETNIVDCEPDELRIGMPLVVDFRPLTEDITLPVFRPVR